MNPIMPMSFGRGAKIALVVLLIGNAVVAAHLLRVNVRYRKENEHLAKSQEKVRAASSSASRVIALQKENKKLKASLDEIPKLAAKKRQFQEREISASQDAAGDNFHSISNRIQQAIEGSKQELREIHDPTRHRSETELRDKAVSRLREKGLPENQTPEEIAKEYSDLHATLRQVGMAMKELVELRLEWAHATDKSESARAARAHRMEQSHQAWQAALNQLGKDRVLYREIPVITPLQNPPERTPVFRSIVPDLRGTSATVYLDGSVVFSR